ncbi:ribokinase [Paracoccus sp. TK19116]|uniref:Ribokinase n=1 Tax=Paracoccus albicereus TaxID=2922394 RepID=A0ABT1MS15_9RHOB|nr:ribokinase [Paracoccus albicereus]MCQ0971097.1 ribokinase [Paracoccus albicereus]
MDSRIGVVGSNNVDLITYIERMPKPGETLEAPDFAMGFGGKGANQAVAAARLGAQVSMVTRIGDDLFGPQQMQNFRENGIDTTHVLVAAGKPSGVAPIMVRPDGENSILIVQGANAALSPADVDAAWDMLAGCRLILLQLEVPLETVYRVIELAVRDGVATILNPAPAAPGLDLARLDGLTFLAPNEPELAMLTGMPTGTEDETLAAAQTLISRGIGQVIVTLGGRGALLVTGQGSERIAPVKVKPVDTTGAGDAFLGSFAHFHAAGQPVAEALAQAARYAALSVTRRGTQTSYADAEAFKAFCDTLG